MATDYNVDPYFDDFDPAKQYYRILFRPGRAVQARELTQIQTALQKQIEHFGQSIYKEGSIVVPGGQLYDKKYNYVRLTTSFGSNTSDQKISSLVNSRIIGNNSKVEAIVVNYTTSNIDDDPTLYVRYVASGPYSGGTNTVFQAGETIVNETGNITLQVVASDPTGVGTAFMVDSGVVFTKGVFAYFDKQTLIVEKYSNPTSCILGFQVTESTVGSEDDTTLLDPAVGASNYIAPGADRYKISLDLAKRPITFDPTLDPNFIELARIENGIVVSKNIDPKYSILGDTLARRTYDESGDYNVVPYSLQLVNHLKSSNTKNDGIYLASEGGSNTKFIAFVGAGKSYVKGYEVENITTRRIIADKARDFANVNSGVVGTTIGNYILVTNLYSTPDMSILDRVSLYNQFNSTPGLPNGTLVGTARVRGMEYLSGTPGAKDAVYKLWLFDVSMSTGYVFERDVKQVYCDNSGYVDFTADIVPELITLSGSITTTNGSNAIVGFGTRFNTELKSGDYIDIEDTILRVNSISNSVFIRANTNVTVNLSGYPISLVTVKNNDTENLAHIFDMPNQFIRNVDPTNLETVYSVKRSYARSLSANTVTITSGTDEVFASISPTNYSLFITSGSFAGTVLNPTNLITRGGSPTGKNITINLSSLANSPANVTALSTADIVVHTTVTKTNSAANKKVKTLVKNATLDLTSNVAATASVISLGKADVFRLVNVTMSTTTTFGGAYSATNAKDITDRYILDNGQKLTYYGLGSLALKAGAAKPTNPIRITFDYFTHGSGDFFSVDSYSDITYEQIPSFNAGSKTYQLRDCLDFRPKINDAGTGFSGTGASVSDFVSPNDDLITDYSYYLPRIDKLVLDKKGNFVVVQGQSSLTPQEPKTPDDSMCLFIIKQKAYVLDLDEDVDIVSIDNRRYTMRDIGRIENRVKNLEYYTTLNLLEQETQSLQIKDGDGFDRFKNGFVVDNFSGHNIGDVYNRDYAVSIDYNSKELRPAIETKSVSFVEVNSDTSTRTANNYALVGDLVVLPYSEVEYVKNARASTTENINPFGIITWTGKVTLDPPGDSWYDDVSLPLLKQNDEGLYDQFLKDAQSKETYGTIWGNWRNIFFGDLRTEIKNGPLFAIVEQIDSSSAGDKVVNRFCVPYMRSRNITFTAEGLKPNSSIYVFFDNYNVTDYCVAANTSNVNIAQANANSVIFQSVTNKLVANTLFTDANGRVSGVFSYSSESLKLLAGVKTLRLTDSAYNANNFETIAEATYTADGQFRYDEYTRPTRKPTASVTYYDYYEPPSPAPVAPAPYNPDIYDIVSGYGTTTNANKTYEQASQLKTSYDTLASSGLTPGDKAIVASATSPQGWIGFNPTNFAQAAATASPATVSLWAETRQTLESGVNASSGTAGLVKEYTALGYSPSVALDYAAAAITVGLMHQAGGTVPVVGGTPISWAPLVAAAATNPVNR